MVEGELNEAAKNIAIRVRCYLVAARRRRTRTGRPEGWDADRTLPLHGHTTQARFAIVVGEHLSWHGLLQRHPPMPAPVGESKERMFSSEDEY